MDVHHREATQPVMTLSTMADSLPGLGIVAAVLGVVIMMGALGGPPEQIGHKVAAALVGTFLGILLCYGLVGPVAANMAKAADEEHAFDPVLRVVILAFLKGTSPIMAVEIGRRAIPVHLRPSFQEAEKVFRGGSGVETGGAAGTAGHPGGAWKVAYADFVTAMMARFIVLWLLNSSKQVQVAVGGYFKDPTGTSKQVGSNMQGSGESFALTQDDMPKLREELQKTVRQLDNFDSLKDHIEMTVTAEGLRIELMESASGTFFESGSPAPTQNGREMLVALAHEVGNLPNKISFEGHTDAKPFARDSNYGNWELSVDRANAARRLMQQNGVKEDQVAQVRGYADQQLHKPNNPEDPSNRRIPLIIQYIVQDQSGGLESDKQPGDIKIPESKGKIKSAWLVTTRYQGLTT